MQSPARGNKTVFFLFLYMLIVPAVIAIALSAVGVDLEGLPLLAFGQVVGFFVPFVFYLLVTKQKPRDVLSLAPLSLGDAPLVALVSISILPMVSLVSRLSAFVFHPFVMDMMVDFGQAPLWAGLLVIGVLPSLLEEFWFRGAIDKEYEAVSVRKRAIITGLFFGIIHANFHQAIYAFLFGILYAYLLYYTKSILAPMLMHFINNSLSVVMFRSASLMEGYMELWENPGMFLLIIGGMSLAMLPVLVLCMRKLRANHALRFPAVAVPPEGEGIALVKPKVFTWAFWLVVVIFLIFAGGLELITRIGTLDA